MSAVKIFAFLDLKEKSWFSLGHYLPASQQINKDVSYV